MTPLARWWLRRRHGGGEWGALLAPTPAETWVSLDLETTGMDPAKDHILSLAAVPVEGGRVRLSQRFERRVPVRDRQSSSASYTPDCLTMTGLNMTMYSPSLSKAMMRLLMPIIFAAMPTQPSLWAASVSSRSCAIAA